MINFSIGLCYAHHALKRGAENRQHLILQSLTFFMVYYDSRKMSHKAEERREAHYNMARVHHMLGLTHLALPFYSLVLEEVEHDGGEEQAREDVVTEAAYNLQTIYSLAGNPELASAITERWLVV
jgi:general transcription factor 3C polypeptide 3 (transcription factor C subunit 4)